MGSSACLPGEGPSWCPRGALGGGSRWPQAGTGTCPAEAGQGRGPSGPAFSTQLPPMGVWFSDVPGTHIGPRRWCAVLWLLSTPRPMVLLRPLLLLPKVVPAFPDSGSWVSVLLLWFESVSLWPVLKHLHPGPCCCGQLATACPRFPFLSCLWGLPPFTWSLPRERVTTESSPRPGTGLPL